MAEGLGQLLTDHPQRKEKMMGKEGKLEVGSYNWDIWVELQNYAEKLKEEHGAGSDREDQESTLEAIHEDLRAELIDAAEAMAKDCWKELLVAAAGFGIQKRESVKVAELADVFESAAAALRKRGVAYCSGANLALLRAADDATSGYTVEPEELG